jgi:hypothetical protein
VTGHSLGAGMVQRFLKEFSWIGDDLKAWTFGSPGSDATTAGIDTPLANFIHTGDLVTFVGSWYITKIRTGSDVFINSEVDSGVGLSEHDMFAYWEDMTKLFKLSNDLTSPFYSNELAQSIRLGTPYAGTDIQVALGTDQKKHH